jgi:DNA-binding protein YbaB
VLGRDLDDAEEWVRSWSVQTTGCAEAAAALADRIAGLKSSATGADGAVRVTVAGSGNVAGLELTDQVQTMSGAELSAEILRAMGRAQAGLGRQVAVAVDETVGVDTDTGRAVLAGFARRFPDVPAAPAAPVMPSPPPFPAFDSRPSLPHQAPGGGFESGRDSRAR